MTPVETFWTPSELTAPPLDKPFWAWLHETGIRLMRWKTPAEVAAEWGDDEDECGGRYVLVSSKDDDYEPEFWAPAEAIADPATEWPPS
ncbi:hypothetical protein [Phenylobacterium sp.]|uniref:hypothetical protein n=1 Tax=Phenylobacterium sp. TaxID=1871053 RepID=UPI00271C98B2|nr:hypothetical protein [Phenylobacterium sp.]MDO8800098.1 hypothetical protein [Phenylobacterium sp.]